MMTYSLKKPLFALGRIMIAPEIEALGIDTPLLLRRHQTGDFGCIAEFDLEQNHHAIECGDGILSQYRIIIEKKQILICVMTEADRSYTVVFILDEMKPESPEAGNNQDPECS